MTDPAFATVAELQLALDRGELTGSSLVAHLLDRIATLDVRLNAFTHVAGDYARAEAEACDAERRAGRLRGPLHGIPVAIKDIIDVAGMPETCGTGGHDGTPAVRDAVLVARLRAAGAIVLGKTNTYEFAYAAYNEGHGYTRNPWDPTRTAGATSGGSAAAVAAGLVPLAVGTDAGGSVRIPAAFCGIVGFKVSHGAIELTGAFPSSWTLDHGGAMGRSVDTPSPFCTDDINVRQAIHSNLELFKPGPTWIWQLDATACIEQVDPTHVDVRLRPGTMWTNGSDGMSAEDVPYSFMRIAKPALRSTDDQEFEPFVEVEVHNRCPGTSVTRVPLTTMGTLLLHAMASITCEKAWEEKNAWLNGLGNDIPCSSGPCMLREWHPNDRVVRVRHFIDPQMRPNGHNLARTSQRRTPEAERWRAP